MPKFVITDNLREELFKYLKKNRKADLITTYLFFLEKKHHLKPVLFPKKKTTRDSTSSSKNSKKGESYGAKQRLKSNLEKRASTRRQRRFTSAPLPARSLGIIPIPILKTPSTTGSPPVPKTKRKAEDFPQNGSLSPRIPKSSKTTLSNAKRLFQKQSTLPP